MEQKSFIERFKEGAAKVWTWVTSNLALVIVVVGALGWVLYKRKALQVDVLALKIRSLLLEKELAKLEERKKADEEAFKSELDKYNALKHEHSDLAKRLGIL